jgi:hypothetical protein
MRQTHSWSQLQITPDAFTKLLTAYKVSSHFLDHVQSFGTKTNDVDGNVGGYSRRENYEFNEGMGGGKRLVSYGKISQQVSY